MADNPFLQFATEQPEPSPAADNPFLQFAAAEEPDPVEPEPREVSQPRPQEEDVGFAKEMGSSFGRGAAGLVRGAGTLTGLVTGNMDNAATRHADRMESFYDNKSQSLRDSEGVRSERVDAADGQLDKGWAWLSETVTDPRLLANMFAEQGANLAVPGAAGAGAARVGNVVAGKLMQRGSAKLASLVSRYTGVAAAVGAGGTLQSADVAGSTYQDIMALEDEEWNQNEAYLSMVADQVDPQIAKDQIARDLAELAGTESFAISIASQFIPGGRAFEKLVGRGNKAGIDASALKRAVGGFVGEGAQEVAEEVGGQLVSNINVGEVDTQRDLTQGLGEAGAAALAIGGPLGAASGAAAKADIETEVSDAEIEAELEQRKKEAEDADRRARGAEADEIAQETAQAVEDQGGDALDQIAATIQTYNEVESAQQQLKLEDAEINERLLTQDAIPAGDLVDTSALTQPVRDIPGLDPEVLGPQQESRPARMPATPEQEAVVDARIEQGEDSAVRLENANRISQLANKADVDRNPELAARYREKAEQIRQSIQGLPVAEVTQETQQEYQPAEQIVSTDVAKDPGVVVEGASNQAQDPQLGTDGVIYAAPEEGAAQRREQKSEADLIAREGIAEPGKVPRRSAPSQPFSSMPQEQINATEAPAAPESDVESVSDEDYGPPLKGESIFTVGDKSSRGALDVVADLEDDAASVAEQRGLEMDVTAMSPSKYIELASLERAKAEQTTAAHEIKKRKESGAEKIASIARDMESGVQFAAPSLDYSEGGFSQDGLHRAMAAESLGLKSIPVSVVRDAPNMVVREKQEAFGEARKLRAEKDAYKMLESKEIKEEVEDEDGNVYEVSKSAGTEVRRINKRLSVMDSLLGCLKS